MIANGVLALALRRLGASELSLERFESPFRLYTGSRRDLVLVLSAAADTPRRARARKRLDWRIAAFRRDVDSELTTSC